MTIDEAIAKLTELKGQSNLGGETVLVVCIPDYEYIEVTDLKVENDQHGAIALVCGKLPAYDLSNEELAS